MLSTLPKRKCSPEEVHLSHLPFSCLVFLAWSAHLSHTSPPPCQSASWQRFHFPHVILHTLKSLLRVSANLSFAPRDSEILHSCCLLGLQFFKFETPLPDFTLLVDLPLLSLNGGLNSTFSPSTSPFPA